MKRLLFTVIATVWLGFWWLILAQDNVFSALEESIQPIENNIDVGSPAQWASGVRDFIINTFYTIGFPLIFGVGLLMAILWIIGLLFSDEEWERAKALKIIGYGVAGIVIIVSARYITYTLLGESGTWWLLFSHEGTVSGISIAQDLYDKIMYPFIKIGFMLIAWVLFVMLLVRVLGFLSNPSDDTHKQSLAIIGWNALGILLIIGAKSIVELIYGKKEAVVNPDSTSLGEIGTEILNTDAASWTISLVYQILNWVVGITAFMILVIIIFQAYQLLMNPEDESKLSQVSKSLMYIFVGILIIGLSYVIANVVLVQ